MLSKAIIATFLAASAVALDVQPRARACDRDNDCVAASYAASAPVHPAEMVSPSSDYRAERVADIA
jgi:hypothetical protein